MSLPLAVFLLPKSHYTAVKFILRLKDHLSRMLSRIKRLIYLAISVLPLLLLFLFFFVSPFFRCPYLVFFPFAALVSLALNFNLSTIRSGSAAAVPQEEKLCVWYVTQVIFKFSRFWDFVVAVRKNVMAQRKGKKRRKQWWIFLNLGVLVSF